MAFPKRLRRTIPARCAYWPRIARSNLHPQLCKRYVHAPLLFETNLTRVIHNPHSCERTDVRPSWLSCQFVSNLKVFILLGRKSSKLKSPGIWMAGFLVWHAGQDESAYREITIRITPVSVDLYDKVKVPILTLDGDVVQIRLTATFLATVCLAATAAYWLMQVNESGA